MMRESHERSLADASRRSSANPIDDERDAGNRAEAERLVSLLNEEEPATDPKTTETKLLSLRRMG